MDLSREIEEYVKTYGKHFGQQGDDNIAGAVEDLVGCFLFNENISPTDDELIHLTVVATLRFVKSWNKANRKRLKK